MFKNRFLIALASFSLLVPASLLAADNMTVKDGNNASKVLGKKDVGGTLYDQNIIVSAADPTIDVGSAISTNTSVSASNSNTIATNTGNTATNTSNMSAKLPASLGAKTGATSLSVVAASDGFSVNCASGCSGGTQYAEDAVAASGNTGTVALGVQVASPASTAADGDWTWGQFTNGKFHVIDLSTNAVLGTASDASSQSGAGTMSAYFRSMRDDLRTLATDTNPISSNITQIGGNSVATGNGVVGTGVQRVAIASDNSNINVVCASGCSGGTQYAEDAAAASGNTGTIALAQQVASPSDLAADGDYAILQMKSGRLFTDSANDLTRIGGNTISTGNGVSGTGVQRVTLASDSTGQVVLATGSNVIGSTIGFAGTVKSSFTRPADTNVYANGDWISDSTSAPTSGGFTLSNMCRISGGSGIITDVIIGSNDTTAFSGKLYILDAAATTTPLDNTLESANNFTDADAAKLVAEVPFSLTSRTSNAVAHVQNLSAGYTCSGSANLRWLLQFTGGTTTTVSGNTYFITAKYVQTN